MLRQGCRLLKKRWLLMIAFLKRVVDEEMLGVWAATGNVWSAPAESSFTVLLMEALS